MQYNKLQQLEPYWGILAPSRLCTDLAALFDAKATTERRKILGVQGRQVENTVNVSRIILFVNDGEREEKKDFKVSSNAVGRKSVAIMHVP